MISTTFQEVTFIQVEHIHIPAILEYLSWSRYMVEKLYRDRPEPATDAPPTLRGAEEDPSYVVRSVFLWAEAALQHALRGAARPQWVANITAAIRDQGLDLQYIIRPTDVVLAIPEEYILDIRKYISIEQMQGLCTTLDLRLRHRLAEPPSVAHRETVQLFIRWMLRTSATMTYSRFYTEEEHRLQGQIQVYSAFTTMLRKKADLGEHYRTIRSWVDRFVVGRRGVTPAFVAKYLKVKEAYDESNNSIAVEGSGKR